MVAVKKSYPAPDRGNVDVAATGFQHSRAPIRTERGCVSETSRSNINAIERGKILRGAPFKIDQESAFEKISTKLRCTHKPVPVPKTIPGFFLSCHTPQMKVLAIILLLATLTSILRAQGSLTPPGAPASSMKTLAQVEARTAITNTGTVAINQPGSYYLTTNITVASGHGVVILCSNVMLDLNGFTLFSTDPSGNGYGVFLSNSVRNITIMNGFVRGGITNNGSNTYTGPGFSHGIFDLGGTIGNILISRVQISGCRTAGILMDLGTTTTIESCHVQTSGGTGLAAAIVRDSSAIDCRTTGISGELITGCRGESQTTIGLTATVVKDSVGVIHSGTYGVSGQLVVNSHGHAVTGTAGLKARNAVGCTGINFGVGGRAIESDVATSCLSLGGTNLIGTKYNMP
jgi:hypothetical protein